MPRIHPLMSPAVMWLVMGLREQQPASLEQIQVLEMVVNHDVAADNLLGTAQHNSLPRNERKMLPQPFHLLGEAYRKFRRGGNNEQLIPPVQFLQHPPAPRNQRRLPEKPR